MSQDLVELFDPDHCLSLVVSSVSNNQATLKANDSTDEVLCPSKWLPKDVRVGDRVVMSLDRLTDFQKRQQTNAKTLLRELLKDDH